MIDEAQRQVRDGKVAPKLLKKLGMTDAQFRSFVEKYSRRFGKLRPMADRTDRPGQEIGGAFELPGSEKLQTGRAWDSKLGNVTGSEKLTPDEIRKLSESKAARASRKYREHVQAYLRAISEGAADTPTTAPAK